jgi:hypothetical protein
VVVDPHDADRQEAGQVAEVGGPDPEQLTMINSVIAIAKTPSLKASVRAVSLLTR